MNNTDTEILRLKDIFLNHRGRVVHKWLHYFDIYEKHFERFRGKEVVIAEIGVAHGGSLEMWHKYFGDKCTVIGIDIDDSCLLFQTDNTKIFIGSQEDRAFLRSLKSKIPKVDILIDDGGHMMNQLKVTFEELYDWVDKDGIYLAEDLHTCYWPAFEGGYKRKTSFIEYCKNLVDHLHADHFDKLKSTFTDTAHSISFYDSVMVIEKKEKQRLGHIKTGYFKNYLLSNEPPAIKGFWRRLRNDLYKIRK
jgi:hypothetical protein